MEDWVRKLRAERKGNESSGTPLIPVHRRIRELEKQLRQIKEENTIQKRLSLDVEFPEQFSIVEKVKQSHGVKILCETVTPTDTGLNGRNDLALSGINCSTKFVKYTKIATPLLERERLLRLSRHRYASEPLYRYMCGCINNIFKNQNTKSPSISARAFCVERHMRFLSL